MDKRFIPVAMLAGALALAGCGGGSSTTAPGSGDPEVDPPVVRPNPPAARPAALPGTGLTNDTGEAYTIRLEKDGEYETPNGGTITCPNDECVITVGAQRGTPIVTATGGATFAAKPAVATPPRDNNAGVQNGNDWLGDRALIGAIKEAAGTAGIYVELAAPNGAPIRIRNAGLDGIIGNADDVDLVNGGLGTSAGDDLSGSHIFDGVIADDPATDNIQPSGSAIGTRTVDTGGGRETKVRLVHTRNRSYSEQTAEDVNADRDTVNNDYLVFGSWMRRTAANSGPTSTPQIGYFRVGTIDRNNVSTYGTGDARYEGKALGHYTNNGGAWTEWNGKVSLEANFAPEERQISGTIDTAIAVTDSNEARIAAYGTHMRGLGTITLQKTSIDGSANGQSRISGSTNNVGTWEADFHGTAINNSPNGVTGEFRTEREELFRTVNNAKVLDQTKATIQGVFGAHNVGQLADTDLQ